MSLVSTFAELLLSFASVMTEPTFQNFLLIAQGWIFARRKRTVTEVIQAAGAVKEKHYGTFHRFFSRARWSMDDVSRILLGIVLGLIPKDITVHLALDDTLCRKRGLHIFGTCMHHDPLISCRKFPLVNWGHNWVVVGVVLCFPFAPNITWCLPFAFRLYISRNRPKSQRWKGRPRQHKTRPELAVEILEKVASWFPERSFHVFADSAYGGKSVVKHLPPYFDLTSRIVLNAQLYDEPEQKDGRGRPRKRGKRLPTPAEVAKDLQKKWKSVKPEIYGKRKKVMIKETSGLWKAAGYRRVYITIVRDPSGKTRDQAFYTTDVKCKGRTTLSGYARRWSIEVAFENSKGHLGFEDPQNWTKKAVKRTAPMAMVFYSLVIVWFSKLGYKKCKFPVRPWYTRKSTPSFVDMLATLRKESAREYFLNTPEWSEGSRKILELFVDVLRMTG